MAEQHPVFTKCAWRLVPFMMLLYLVAFIDRTNVGFAALTMNKDLGFSPTVFGFGSGIFFVGYALFMVPANVILERIGARRWIFCILAAWGLLSASTALVNSAASFYAMRFSLGVAEAGFFPGMLLYLSFWFPRAYRAQLTANFMVATALATVVGGPLSSVILGLGGVAGLHPWQWMFLLEGIPAILLSFAALKLLPDGPKDALWLTGDEKTIIASRLTAEDKPGPSNLWQGLHDPRVLALCVSGFLMQSCAYGIQLWLPQMIHEAGFTNFATGLVIVLPFFLGACGMILCGRSSFVRGEQIWHAVIPILLASMCLAIASVAQSKLMGLFAVAFGMICYYTSNGPFYSLPSTFLRGSAAAGGIGLFAAAGGLGGFFGPSLIGILKEGSGNYSTAMAAVALGFVLAALIVLAVGRALALRPKIVQPAI